jgi:transcription termination factor NusB
MTISAELTQLLNESKQRTEVFRARARLQEVRETIINADSDIAAIIAAGQFDTIPATTKAALQAALAAIRTCKTVLAGTAIAEALDWKGT